MFTHNRLKEGTLFCLFLFFHILFSGCQKDNKSADAIQDYSEQFIKDYDISDASKAIEKKKDSLGALVLTLPNSSESRNLLNEFGSRIKGDKKYADKLLEYAIQSQDTIGIGKGYLLMGNYYGSLLSHDKAYSYYCEAENIFLKKRDSLNISYTLLLKAVVLNKDGVFYEAEKEILQSIRYNTEETFLRRKYQQYLTVGDIYGGLELFDDALYFYKQTLDVINSKEIEKEVYSGVLTLHRVYVLSKIAVIYHNKKNYDKAEEILVNTISNYIDLSNADSERYYGYLAVNLANVRMKQNQLSEVKPLLDQAIHIGEKNRNRIIIHNAQVALAEYYYLTQRQDLATPLLKTVIAKTQSAHDLITESKALELLIMYVTNSSENYFTQYLEVRKALKGESNIARNNFMRIKNETEVLLKKNKELGSTNRRLIIFGCGLFVVLINVLLFYFYRAKTRKLKIVKMFHRDAEQYYNSIINIHNYLALTKEKERQVMAKELHDGVYNRVFATRFSLMLLGKENIEKDIPLLVNEITEVENYIREITHYIDNESAKQIDRFGQLLHNLIVMQKVYSTIEFNLYIDDTLDLERLNHRKRINVYQSIQKVLSNTILYSQATKCDIKINATSLTSFEISITDDGVGFDVKTIKKGFGLTNSRERIEIIGGKFLIFSKKEVGTRVLFSLSY